MVEWDEDGKWVPPPTGVRLSDELAYIATKSDMSNKTLKQTYPFDFDGNGMIKASRTPEDPAPLIRAHGLPFIAVARDTVALSGRKHTFLCAALLDKNDKNIKSARSAFTIGTIVATKTFVDMPRTIDRQLFTHSGMYPESRNEEATRAEANFPKEFRPAGNARDTMSSLHNALATLMGKPVTVIRLIDLPAYRLTCGPGNDSTTIGESFVNKFATQPYSNLLALDYVNADDVQAPITQQAETAATPEKKKTRRSRKHEQTTQAKTQQEDKLEHHIDPLLRLKAGGVKEVADDKVRQLIQRIEQIPNTVQDLRRKAQTDDTPEVRDTVRRHQQFHQDRQNALAAVSQLARDIETVNPLFKQFLRTYLASAASDDLRSDK